jgi:hypothetical protein
MRSNDHRRTLHVRIHRTHIMAGLLQPVIDQVADGVVAVVARYARNSDALLSEEVLRFGIERHCRS